MLSRLTLVLAALLGAQAPAPSQFAERGAVLLPRVSGQTAAGTDYVATDVDGDGDEDLLIAYDRVVLQLNDGRGRYRDVTATHMPAAAVFARALAAADVDRDGDSDLVLATGASRSNRLYLNDGSGRFSDATGARMPSRADSTTSVVAADMDNDGDVDLVFGNSGQQNTLYLNDGSGTFSDATAARMPLTALATQACAVGDVDGDSDLDIVFGTAEPAIAYWNDNELFLNDGSGRFTNASSRLFFYGHRTHDLELEDLDGDGDLDLIEANDYDSPIRINDGSGLFATRELLPPARFVKAADFDRDGDTDLVLDSEVWLNDGGGRFSRNGGMPIEVVDYRGGVAQLGAGVLSDADSDGDLDWISGNAQNRLQRNDGNGFFGRLSLPRVFAATAAFAAADVDGDGDEDLAVANFDSNSPPSSLQNALYLNDGAGGFEDVTSSHLPTESDNSRAVVLRDLDGDGDADMVVCNGAVRGTVGQNRAYLNDGTGVFTSLVGALASVTEVAADIAMGDVDGDGDPDLVVANEISGYLPSRNRLHLNDGTGRFSDVTQTHLPLDADDTVAVAMADVDGDGDQDLIFANDGQQDRLYLNDGAGVFTDATARLPSLAATSRDVAAADLDGDGDCDLVFANGTEQARLLLNDGSGTFTDVTATHLPPNAAPWYAEGVTTGDVDLDGDPDVVFAARALSSYGRPTAPAQNRVYRNDGSGRFTDATVSTLPMREDVSTSVALHDLDGDGDPEYLVVNEGQSWVYTNLHRQLDAPAVPAIGRTYDLDVHANYASSNPAVTVFPLLATGTASIPLPPWGVFRLDPARAAALPIVVIPQPGERRTLSLPIPAQPNLVGVPLFGQALFVRGANVRLSNLTADRIR